MMDQNSSIISISRDTDPFDSDAEPLQGYHSEPSPGGLKVEARNFVGTRAEHVEIISH